MKTMEYTFSLLNDFHNVRTETEAWITLLFFAWVGAAFAGIAIFYIMRNDNYRQGQIDALRGIVKYELTKNKDGEEVWREITKQK